ncbi:ECF transporter S component [Erysipelatoclostridium sp. AM42-17]|nr:ECF transporter S component [Coprobacillus sp. AF33-1AC]RHS91527.1 ECF transporter S component [Erysipelatoclostridium sp. AM42-17]
MMKKEFELSTRTMTYMAIFAALQIVLEYCTKIYEMPKGGNIAFSLVPIFLCSYLMNWKYGVVVSLVSLGVQFALGLAVFYGPLSVIFDYIIPMVLVGMTGLIPLAHYKQYEIPVGIIVMCVLKTISHLLAGWYAFATPLKGNLTYNLPYNIGTLIVCFILFMILYPRLKKTVRF